MKLVWKAIKLVVCASLLLECALRGELGLLDEELRKRGLL